MQKNSLITDETQILRVLAAEDDKVFVIDCRKRTVPKWITKETLSVYRDCTEAFLQEQTDMRLQEIDSLDAESRRIVRERYTMIAPVLPFISDEKQRRFVINAVAEERNISKQTLQKYLFLYLVYQEMSVLAPKQKADKPLTLDEKNMRWAINKFYLTQRHNPLTVAYSMMLRAKYCDSNGVLLPEHPSIHQFRRFERKYRKLQNYFISREGLSSYQRNNRPLLGDGVQSFAPTIGTAMLDSTVCDIYLVDDAGNLVGRPILMACIDANSSMCCGYSLEWESGTYGLRGLMLNVIADKVEYCRAFGISISKKDWDCSKLPGTLVTDMGSEYKSYNFEQITELGVTLINLPAYRPELKGCVEKFFDLVQDYYKPYLKGKGVIEPDFKVRGAKDYRKEACLTLKQFECILLRCIIYYNTKRVLKNYPYTAEMLQANIQPYANEVWNHGEKQLGADLITISRDELVLTLLPRTQGRFTRHGLKVNGLRYRHDNFKERFLAGGTVTAVYNPEDASEVWLVEGGTYIRFELIESRFKGKNLDEVKIIQKNRSDIVKDAAEDSLQAQIELANHIEAIVHTFSGRKDTDIKGIRRNRERERNKHHVDYMKGDSTDV